jgi:ribosomal protein L16 Arg81 hydroxylase
MRLDDILAPDGRERFFSTCWNRMPTTIRGDREKFDSLPPSSELPAMCIGKLDWEAWQQTSNQSAQATYAQRTGEIVHLSNVPISMYAQLYNSGYSLCFGDVSRSSEVLRRLVADVSSLSALRSNTSVTCYLTPPRSTGVVHFDHQHVFFLQREGTKYWRISERPAVTNPYENFLYLNAGQAYFDEMERRGYRISVPADCGFRDIELTVGDVLYLPPGYYHAHHTEAERSFHYTLTLESVSFWSLFMASMYLEALKHSSGFNDDIRALDTEGRKAHLEAQLGTLRNRIEQLSAEQIEEMYESLVR